ncbi:MAG: hypothetical protein QXV73_04040 [Candidatus Micrarchaeia archaeon]
MKPLSDNWEFFRAFTDSYISVQKVRVASENRVRSIIQGKDENEKHRKRMFESLALLKKNEKEFVKMAKQVLIEEPVYNEFLAHIRGIGETLAMKILSFPLDLEKNVSSWWAMAGLVPVVWKCECEKGHKILLHKDPEKHLELRCYANINSEKCDAPIVKSEMAPSKLHAGYRAFWNGKLKQLGYIITDEFIKLGIYYRKAWEKFRDEGLQRGMKPIHANRHARRLTYKLFLSHLHECGCELKGIPYRKPYAFEFLNHKWFIGYKDVVSIEKTMKEKN